MAGESDHIADLLDWDRLGATSADSFARLRASPCYPNAARAFARAMLAQAEADRALDGILKDAGRNVAAKCLAYLHVTGGLTLPRLKALCASTGLVSRGRARALLAYLLYLGYATPSPHRVPRCYEPTARFLATWRRHMSAILESAAVVEPGVLQVLACLDVPTVFTAYVRCISEAYLEGLQNVAAGGPFFRIFMHRYAGTQIIHGLVATTDDAFPPEDPIAFTYSEIATRFSVSRLHVRRMMDDARREGLVRLADNRALILTPAGRAAVDHIYATQLIVFLVAAARTIRACPELLAADQAAWIESLILLRSVGARSAGPLLTP